MLHSRRLNTIFIAICISMFMYNQAMGQSGKQAVIKVIGGVGIVYCAAHVGMYVTIYNNLVKKLEERSGCIQKGEESGAETSKNKFVCSCSNPTFHKQMDEIYGDGNEPSWRLYFKLFKKLLFWGGATGGLCYVGYHLDDYTKTVEEKYGEKK